MLSTVNDIPHLCLRLACTHHADRGWQRPASPQPTYAAADRLGRAA